MKFVQQQNFPLVVIHSYPQWGYTGGAFIGLGRDVT